MATVFTKHFQKKTYIYIGNYCIDDQNENKIAPNTSKTVDVFFSLLLSFNAAMICCKHLHAKCIKKLTLNYNIAVYIGIAI